MAGTWPGPRDATGADTVLRAEDVVVEFPLGRSGLVVSAVAGISLDVLRGETLGPRRRVGLRQDESRPRRDAAAAADGRCDLVRRPRPDDPRPQGDARRQDGDADDLPGPDRRPQPAAHPPRQRARAAAHLGTRRRRRAGVDRRSRPRGGRHRPGPRRREPAAPVLGRAVPARRDRQGARARAEPGDLRRTGVVARRQRARPGAQPARGPQGSATACRCCSSPTISPSSRASATASP